MCDVFHARGPTCISTADSSVLASGSRHDRLVAAVCGVGVASVHAARRAAAGSGTRTPAKRERARRQHQQAPEHASGREPCYTDGAVNHDVAAALSRSAPAPPPNAFGEEKRVALVLGRLYMHAAVTNLPDYRVRSILAQFLLAGVPVGQRLHSERAVHNFTGVAAKALGMGRRGGVQFHG